jgi:hypothetical protein
MIDDRQRSSFPVRPGKEGLSVFEPRVYLFRTSFLPDKDGRVFTCNEERRLEGI